MANKAKFIIRKESIPRKWAKLDSEQKDALYRILGMMEAYVHNANNASHKIKTKKDYPALRLNDDSNTLFLDGARGTGKSTVLYSLLNATINGKTDFFEDWVETSEEETSLKIEVERIIEAISTNSLIWLESLDLELLPQPSNLFAALMVRIEDIFKREGINKEDTCFPYESTLFPTQSDHPWTKFSQLMRSVSIGWSTNLEGRKNSDPDTYSEEVIKTERARLKLKNFNQIIADLADYLAVKKNGKKPLFVLPVDDADLNPSRALDFFQLTRMISSPNILFLVAGHYENLEKLFELKYASDLSEQYFCKPRSDEHQKYILQFSKNTGYAAIKKLIPKGDQFIELKGLTVSEACRFPNIDKEKNSNELNLGEVLNLIELPSVKLPSENIKPSQNLGDLFFMSISKDDTKKELLQISEILAGPIRAIYDLWRELLSLNQEMQRINSNEDKLEYLTNFIYESYKNSLSSEGHLPDWAKDLLINVFQKKGFVPKLEQKTNIIQITPALSIDEIENTTSESGPFFVFQTAQEFNVAIQQSDSTKEPFYLDTWRSAWLLLYHDLSLRSPKRAIHRLDFNEGTQEWAKSTTLSKQSLLLNWPSLNWFEFHHLDTFKTYWKLFVDGQPKSTNTDSEQDKLDMFAYIWIRGLTYIVTEKRIPLSMTDRSNDKIARWNTHVIKIIDSYKLDKKSGFRIQYFVDLIKTVAIIISPERGVSLYISEIMYDCLLKMLKKLQNVKNNFSHPSTNKILNAIAQTRAEDLLSIKDGKMQLSFEDAYENLEYVVSSCLDDRLSSQYINGQNKKIAIKLDAFQKGVRGLKDIFKVNNLSDILDEPHTEKRSSQSPVINLLFEIDHFRQRFLDVIAEYNFEGQNAESKKNFNIRIFAISLRVKKMIGQINDINTYVENNPSHPNSPFEKLVSSGFWDEIKKALTKLEEDIDPREYFKYKNHPFEKYHGPQKYIYTDYPLGIKTVLGKALTLLQPLVSAENKYAFDTLTELVQYLPESGERYQPNNA